ncbi:stress responsive A/B barrel domain protein [Daldinia vernicosa]|uniref:stress responsive A/B barrel domain protein n=1 Tax=Daldinia vernicosa TaxID=114800 RepID=UPI002008C873|nr:stress responsive A/B barrel domain protein [Daldinia vernicosa]KAI0845069.1 stress responsive A/B barrel domain protein [Daldinia vernicosa]
MLLNISTSALLKHLVLYQFKANVSTEIVNETNNRMLSLKEGCLTPTKQPYIRDLTGGKEMSIEGASQNLQYAFTVEFASVEDRNYYVNNDSYHHAFKAYAIPYLENFVIVDYVEGAF